MQNAFSTLFQVCLSSNRSTNKNRPRTDRIFPCGCSVRLLHRCAQHDACELSDVLRRHISFEWSLRGGQQNSHLRYGNRCAPHLLSSFPRSPTLSPGSDPAAVRSERLLPSGLPERTLQWHLPPLRRWHLCCGDLPHVRCSLYAFAPSLTRQPVRADPESCHNPTTIPTADVAAFNPASASPAPIAPAATLHTPGWDPAK